MADEHAGFSLSARVNYAGLTKANEQTLKWYENARKVESLMSGMRVSNALPRDIQKLDDVTASYVRRLESEGKTYKANKVVVNAYQAEIDKLTRRQKGLESQLEHVAQKFGKNSQQFKEQQIRINENATALNRLKSNYSTASRSVSEYATQMSKLQRELHANTAVQSSEINKLSSAGKAYEAAKVKSEAYKSSIDNLTKQQALQVKELERIAIETGKSSEAYKAQKIVVNETATKVSQLNKSINQTQVELDKLRPTGFNRIYKASQNVDKGVTAMKNSVRGAFDKIKGGATVATAGIVGVGAAAMSGAKESAAVQQKYREINNLAVLGGEKQKEVTRSITEMQRQGRDMSIKYGKSQEEIAAGYEDLVKRGYTTKQAVGALQTELQASVASGDKFSDVTTVSSQVLDAFGLRADDTAKMLKNTTMVVNELAYSADATSTGFSDLGIAMSYVGTAAKANNISLAETASALGVLSNNGLESDKAGTALRSTINGLTNQINKIGSKNSVFTKLGITKSEMLDAHGNLKSLSEDMAILYKHIQEHSKGGSEQNGFFKSIFGTTGMNGAEILAKSSKEVEELTKRTEEAGKTGTYVAKLAAKNMGTAQGSAASAKQAMNAFKMTLGNAVLPAVNEASNALAKFLLSKDGEQFQKNVGGAVRNVANSVVNFIEFAQQHQTLMKFVGGGFLAGYSAVKVANLIQFIGKTRDAYLGLTAVSPKLQKLNSVMGELTKPTKFKNMSKTGKLVLSASVAFDAYQIGNDFYKAATAKTVKDQVHAIGSGAGSIIGGAIGASLGGVAGAQIGMQLGQAMGPKVADEVSKALGQAAVNYKYPHPRKEKIKGKIRKVVGHDAYGRIYQETTGVGKRKHISTVHVDERNQAEKHWAQDHYMPFHKLLHPNNLLDFAVGTGSEVWNAAGHIGDKDFWKRSASELKGKNSEWKDSWLEGTTQTIGKLFNPNSSLNRGKKNNQPKGSYWDRLKPAFSWIHPVSLKSLDNSGRKLGQRLNPFRDFKIEGFNWSKTGKDVNRNISSWWSGLVKSSPKSGALTTWLTKGFHPQVHSKMPSVGNMELSKAGILPFKFPKLNGKKWATGITKDIKGGWKGFTKWSGDLGRNSSEGFKKKWRNFKSWAGGIKRNAQHGWKGFKNWAGTTSKNANTWFKKKWHGMEGWAGNIHKNVKGGWKGFKNWAGTTSKNANDWFKKKWHGMGDWADGIKQKAQNGWKGFKKWFGNLGQSAIDLFKKPFEGLGKWVEDHVPKPIRDFVGKTSADVKSVWNKVASKKTKAHAMGGSITTAHRALVGEAGPELAYKPYASSVRLLGSNGPQFTQVQSGEKILNASDTAKVMAGGLGKGKILKGYANGTTKLVPAKNKRVNATHSINLKTNFIDNRELLNVKNSTRKVTENYQQLTSKSEKSLNKFARSSSTTWRKVTTQTNKQTTKLHKNSVSDFTHMRKGVDKQMDVMHDAVVDTARATARGFGKALDKMQDYARDAMKATIAELNKGITGVDRVLAEFGGNGTAIKPVHFATGSNGELQNNTLAVVNDATSGPRQEAIVRGNNLILPHGKDRLIPLQKGDQVLNGTQTQKMAEAFGLPHFAKGSGVKDGGLKNLYNIAKNNWKHPEETGKRILPQSVPNVKGGAGKIANAANKVGMRQGLDYWSTLWGMVQNKVEDADDSGPASGLLKAAEKYGEGKSYVWGAANGSSFDCSGLVMYTLKRAYGIDFPHFSGSQYALTEHISKSSARMGDLVFWGSGGSDHVGIYAGGNKYFSAQSPSQGIHMNTLDSVVGKGAPLFGRVKGVNTEGSKSTTPKIKAKNGIQKFVKASVGSGFWRTIQKIADEFGNGSMANPAGDSVMRWKPVIRRAAEKMHVRLSDDDMNRILTVTTHESGGNPNSINTWDSNAKAGTPSKGVIQFIQPTFDKYAVKGHHNINSGYDQYLAMFNDSTWRSDLKLGGWGPTGAPRGYAKGGNAPARTPFIAGEHGPELITANGPVHIDSHEQTKRKLSDIKNLMSPKTMRDITSKFTINKPRNSVTNTKPVININITGPISSKSDATKYADMIADKIASVFERIGDDYGLDPSIF